MLSDRLKLAMELRQIDQLGLAKRLGIRQPSINAWLSGKTKSIKGENLIGAAKILNVSVEWLANGAGEMLSYVSHLNPKPVQVEENRTFYETCITIRGFESAGSMGCGLTLPDYLGEIYEWKVARQWIERNIRVYTGLENLAIVTGFGDSMRPMFNSGDPILVDTGVKTVVSDGVYFFRIGSEGFIKRLQRIPTENGMLYIKALSQNPEYTSFDITNKMDFEVLARVIRVWCGTDY